MYLWNTKKLIADLKIGLSEKEAFKYYLATFITMAIGYKASIYLHDGSIKSLFATCTALVLDITGILIVIVCFKINKEKYLERIISITWIITVRVIAALGLVLM